MKKKIFAGLFAASILIASTVTASADVIWEPYNDSFYNKYRDDAQFFYYAKSYISDKDIDIYDQPNKKVIGTLKAGTPQPIPVIIEYKGSDWGAFDYSCDGEYVDAWICLDGMATVYDSGDFTDEHADEIVPYEGDPAVETPTSAFYMWKYPGSPIKYQETYYGDDDNFSGHIQSIYKDEHGTWGYIGYMYGQQNAWVFIDDMYSAEPEALSDIVNAETEYLTIPAETSDAPQSDDAEETSPEAVNSPEIRNSGISGYVICGVIAAAAVAVSAVLLRIFTKKK